MLKKNVIYLKFKFQIKFSRVPGYHGNRGKHHNIYNYTMQYITSQLYNAIHCII